MFITDLVLFRENNALRTLPLTHLLPSLEKKGEHQSGGWGKRIVHISGYHGCQFNVFVKQNIIFIEFAKK